MIAAVLSSERVSPPSAVTRTRALPLLLNVVSSLRLIRGKWQGAVLLPADLEGVMMGASGQGPQEGCLLVVIPCYLCRGHGGHLDAHILTLSLALSHSQTAAARSILWLPLGERWEEGSKQQGVFAQTHTTPHPSPSSLSLYPHLPRRHNYSSLSPPLPLSPPVLPSIPSGVLVQSRFSADIIL